MQVFEPESPEKKAGSPESLLNPYHCGCGPFHPKWLQVFARKKFMTFLFCSFVCLHSSVVSGEDNETYSNCNIPFQFSFDY